VEIDGEEVAEIGPARSSASARCSRAARARPPSRARTACRIAVIPGELIERDKLEGIAATRGA
jgi:hypothetical protein